MIIKIDKSHLELIKAYGIESYPNECCGFLLGRHAHDEKEVFSTLPAANSHEEGEKYHRFLITPEQFLQGEKYARERNMDIVGFYHSHPDAEAKPSTYDLEHGWPWYSYVIVSVTNEGVKELTSWVLEDDRSKFVQEEVIIIEHDEAEREIYSDI
jgi:proteasome lid subunit RPN8/RPN11